MTEHLAQLQTIIAGSPLRNRSAELLALVQPAVHLRKRMTEAGREGPRRWFGLRRGDVTMVRQALPVALGASKLGGLPDVPAGFEWPQLKGKPLGFIGQLRCADLPVAELGALWPADGLLHFFSHLEGGALAGGHSAEKTPFVVYTESTDGLRPAQLPAGAQETGLILHQFGLELELVPTLPDVLAPETFPLEFNATEDDAYFRIREELLESVLRGAPDHQAGGHSCLIDIQCDIRVEFELSSTSNANPRTEDAWNAAAGRAEDWRLLLQVDTDDDLGVMWGNLGVGMAYFGIRADDLRQRRFHRAQVMMQCS